MHIALSPGVWRRAGMAGAMSGIDWAAAKILAEGIAEGGSWPVIACYLARFEGGAITGDAKRHKDKKEDEA